ncbi:hypothetical protein AB1Y20_009583 [Prymnesium parvum]|uniref:Uncharacterized protein n=1 Tax=Prymnesium parvum TaxID=97485 RepID=A0AB34ICI6_PRYPA
MQSCNTCPHCHHLRGGDNQNALHQGCRYERIHKNDHLECLAKARLVAQDATSLQHKQHSGRWCSTESTAQIVAAERATDRTDRFDPVLLTDRCVA